MGFKEFIDKEAVVLKAPNHIDDYMNKFTIFLAGSIDDGTAENWQEIVVDSLKDKNVLLFNPRRDDWGSKYNLKQQIEWELDYLEEADLIIYYVTKDSKVPITLLELGLYMKDSSKKILIYCHKDFYRFTNVETTSERYGHKVYTDHDLFIEEVKKYCEG
jgi:hypothetical protein